MCKQYFTNLRNVRFAEVAIIECMEGEGTIGSPSRLVTYFAEKRANGTNYWVADPSGTITHAGQKLREVTK